jgi:Tfp pilus assembly protein FimT
MSKKILLPTLVVAVIAVTTLFGVLNFSQVSAQTPTETPAATEVTSDASATTTQEPGGRPHGERVSYSQQDLADALGIELTELQAAYETANTEALKLAVEQGLITQAQADEITARGLSSGPLGGSKHLFSNDDGTSSIDYNALLAEALGISSDELTSAYLTAYTTAVNQAVTDGTLTQAQADLMIGRAALAADATFQSSIQAAYAAAVQQAVADGVITQAQADAILQAQQSQSGRSFFDFESGFGGRHGHGGSRGGSADHDGMQDSTVPTQQP